MRGKIHANRSLSYRPEIDGLRALSVLGVIFFHFGMGFPGGYIGVDVFFVISGFLITSIIDRELRENRFSFRNFWVRRIRRILPAASVLTLGTIAMGLWILDAPSLHNLGRSAVANCLMASNYFFWSEAGYFSESAELKPLLHTWSLSVEEQFYLVLPILMFFLFRCLPRVKTLSIAILFVISLLLCIFATRSHPEAAFYFLPTRAWELLAGSLVALTLQQISLTKFMSEIFSAVGIFIILGSMFTFTSETPFPGSAAAIPVFGSCLFLIANSHQSTLFGTILSSPPFVIIGLMSYSLYLWHWPIVVFAHHIFTDVTLLHSFALLFLTFALGAISWRFVEIPFRESSKLRNPKSTFLFGTAVSVLVAFVAIVFVHSKGFPSRFDRETQVIMEDVQWTGTRFKEKGNFPDDFAKFGDPDSDEYDFVVWGDSHAMVLGPTFEELSKKMQLSGLGIISPARPPVTGLWMPGSHSDPNPILSESSKRFNWICEQGIPNIILVGRWDAMCAGDNIQLLNAGYPRKDPKRLMVSDKDAPQVTSEESAMALKRQLNLMLVAAEAKGINIWIILQVPEAAESSPSRNFLLSHRFPLCNVLPAAGSTSRSEYLKRRAISESVFRSLSSPNLRIVDPIEQFYNGSQQLQLYGDRAFYRDQDHLTRRGADHYLAPLIEDVLIQIREKAEDAPIDKYPDRNFGKPHQVESKAN